MRTSRIFSVKDPKKLKEQLLSWSRQFKEIAWLDSNEYDSKTGEYEAILAVEAFTAIKTDYVNAFDKLKEYQETTADWIFGYLSYDLKNDVENLKSSNYDGLHFPDLYFFQPQKLVFIKQGKIEFHYLRMVDDEIEDDLYDIQNFKVESDSKNIPVKVEARISKEEYLDKIRLMLNHIHRGDIYEANFCQEFYAENVEIDAFNIYKSLNEISSPPFAAYLKLENFNLISASPERYLRKRGQALLSQPIKGTARRADNIEEDRKIALELADDPKEQSENVMIVDLVRNDLSRIARKGSVKVEELCKVYAFKQVHQLISSVTAEIADDIPPVEALRTSFPMGSMTGAPKISAMKIIEKLEESKRGLYSGAVGYFTPNGDFDFNVVIRSIIYNSENNYLSFSVGGAITAKSDPEKEYEECLLKARAMRKVLTNL
ncbi:aminodeoxychorismate synthase component I [Christiangramia forsetii]|uniref:aminodeoxychorismate synthase n=2 Tax=Christiangramia forsetii TaxID=411153 RepID=A0M3C4_CHRFK|nr:aminodeoxychorismate synthase component I [Christiangramia forsetii]GGG26179.1 para-aminobenzoate synthase [Christiangramia forsetii]CAL67119.1 anthranilate synthase component I [Christiangramia forsetii KT0803]